MAARALPVGINDYPGIQNDIQGCASDPTNVYDILGNHFGYASSDMRMLSDQRATRAAILVGLKRLLAASKPRGPPAPPLLGARLASQGHGRR